MAQIEVKTKQGRKRFELTDRPITIGRADDNTLVLKDDRASRHHCVIERGDSGFLIRDLKSRNGTTLNDEQVESNELGNGDIVKVGRTKITFIDPEQLISVAEIEPSAPLEEDFFPPDLDTLDVDLHAEVGQTAQTNWERRLEEIIASGEEKGFDETDISLVDNRGVTVHQAQSGNLDTGRDGDGAEGTRAFRKLLYASFRTRATDLHIEPRIDGCTVRLRVDGTMITAVQFSKQIFKRILGIVKILCEIETSQKNQVQDGHFSVSIKGRRVDYRVSLTPSVHGQKLVIRVLDASNSPSRLHELGMVSWMYDKLRTIATRDAGLLLACGPTGSGKTTSLYSCLREIDVEQRNAITIEDPVEYFLEGCTQIPIDHGQGTTFHSVLRSVLRQDPDVIFVGEIRDIETATVAMQASMTGHLVYTTVHAKDTIGAVFRLLDLGIEAPLVANALNLIVAQRLVRLLCPTCRKAVAPTPSQTLRMGQQVAGLSKVYVPQGCKKCLRTGFHGRRALFELLEITDGIRDLIMKEPSIKGIRGLAQQGLFMTLEQFGYTLVADGQTTFDEIERVAGSE
ncbi:MAG: Flp pilus assembly complex ATPase component [Planctomycetes bacterium]|nr:Flp pilus assembly complex ATPase component [Planctomycetota bacterium]MCP4839614.1 Flp pilus assembly complex ATPase component [Planctomycetota bacterium]